MPGAELVINDSLSAVPRVRRFVRSSLSGSATASDAELIAAELVTNALLHGSTPVTLRLHAANDNVRIEVEDSGVAVPVRAIASDTALTGRGLTLVESLATRWGVMPCRGLGKVVWAAIGDGDDEFLTDLAGRDAAPNLDSEPTYEVSLGAVPTDLLLEAKAHIDNVVREMVLLGGKGSSANSLPSAMAELVAAVTEDFADARTEIKRQALLAAERGDQTTDLKLTLPLSAAAAGERYLAALDEADRFARTSRLLTLAPPPSHRTFREWYVRAIIDQLDAAATGTPATSVTPFTQILTSRINELTRLEESEGQLRVLQQISAAMVAESSIDAIATAVVTAAGNYQGVTTARVYLLTPQFALRSVAWAGATPPTAYDEISLASDLPAATVARTGAPLSVDSIEDLYDAHPDLRGYFADAQSLHVAPLKVADSILGILSLSFAQASVAEDGQRAFVQSIADALAQAIERAQAKTITERERGRDLLLLTAQVDVLTDIVNGVELPNALSALLAAIETGSSDGMLASVLLLDENGRQLRHGAAPSLPAFYNSAIDGIAIGDNVGSCGTAAYFRRQVIVDDIRTDPLWTDFRELAERAGVRACWSTPIFDRRGRLLGTFAIYYPQPQSPSTGDLALISVLVRAVAMAIERSRADEARDQALAAERAAAITLQHGLSSSIPAAIGPLELAAHYRTGDPGVQVGGDWYDAVAGQSGTFLIVGDVQGHDLQAAVLMSQLRTVARVAATEGGNPSDILAAVNRYLVQTDEERLATALIIRLDLNSAVVTTASAGHLPPLSLRRAEGAWQVSEIEVDPGPPLGVGTSWEDLHTDAEPGGTLLLYTDGLVESRRWPIDHGLGLLHKAMSNLPADADLSDVLDAALDILPSGSRADDVAVLAASIAATSVS